MSATLRAGIIGLGILGKQYAELLHAHPSIEIAGVCDLRRSAADAFASQYGTAACYDPAVLLTRKLDLVIVATPDAFHREPTVAAIRAGVPNIIQEKPFATTAEDADAIYEAVEQSGTRMFLNFANRAAPYDMATRYIIQNGLIGDPVYGDVRLDDNISVPTRLWGTNSQRWAAASSPAHFLLSHVVDLLRWYFAPAEVTDVYAIRQQRVLGFTPDLYDAYLTFSSGLKVRVKAEWIKHMDELVEFDLSFSGSTGTVIYHKLAGFGMHDSWRANLPEGVSTDELVRHMQTLNNRKIAVRAALHPQEQEQQPGSGTVKVPTAALESSASTRSSGMALIDHVIEAILTGESEPESWRGFGTLPDHRDGQKQTEVVLAIVTSSEQGEPVALARS